MANYRRRMIDPSFWDDPEVGKLPSDSHRLFALGCISIADDQGRLLADSCYLRSIIFKYQEKSLAEVTEIRNTVCERLNNFQLYTVSEHDFIALLKWKRYQTIRKDLKRKSLLPSAKKADSFPLRGRNESVTAPVPKSKVIKSKVKESNTIKSQPSATPVEKPVDNFQERCPIKNHTDAFASTLFAKIREAQGKGIGEKEGEQYLKAALFSCAMVRKRWFYAGCTEDHLKTCEKFIGLCVEHLKDQVADKSRRIRWGPAYLAAIIEEEINNYGENYFKSLGLAHDRKLAEKVERK